MCRLEIIHVVSLIKDYVVLLKSQEVLTLIVKCNNLKKSVNYVKLCMTYQVTHTFALCMF